MRSFIKVVIILTGAVLAACDNGNVTQFDVELDESKTILDILQLPEYESLNRDEKYVEYISDLWDVNYKEFQKGPDLIKVMADIPEFINADDKTSENDDDPFVVMQGVLDVGKWVGGGLFKTGSYLKGQAKILSFESRRNKLFSGFSDKKKVDAIRFEKVMNNLISYTNALFDDQIGDWFEDQAKGKTKRRMVYKHLKPSVKEDKELMKLIIPMFKNADDFFLICLETKYKIKVNFLLADKYTKPDYTSLVEYGTTILDSNGENDVNIDSRLLHSYFTALNKLTKSIHKLENTTYSTPIEDWSTEKRASLEFSVSNIKRLVRLELEAINIEK